MRGSSVSTLACKAAQGSRLADFLHLGSILSVVSRVLETLGLDGESQPIKFGAACFGHPVSHPTLGPLGQPEKAIGHESPIEPWLAPDHRSACSFQNWLARRKEAMKTARRGNQKRYAIVRSEPSS
jgi:hypothetical protein